MEGSVDGRVVERTLDIPRIERCHDHASGRRVEAEVKAEIGAKVEKRPRQEQGSGSEAGFQIDGKGDGQDIWSSRGV